MLDGGDIGGYGGSGGFGGSSDAGATGYGYDAYGNPTGTNTTNNAQQVAYDIVQAMYATQGKRFGNPATLDQYGNTGNSGVNSTYGLTGTNMGYNPIDANFTPNTTPATVNLMDPNLKDPMGGGVGNTPAGGYSFGGMTPQNSDGGLMSDGGGERPYVRPNRPEFGGESGWRPIPGMPGNVTNTFTTRPNPAYTNAYNQWEGGDY